MPKSVTALRDTKIKNAKPRAKEYNLSDGYGLFLRIKPNGSKSWLFNYTRPITSKRTNIGLGKYPEVSLVKARALRESYRSMLSEGLDPKHVIESQKQAQAQQAANTFELIAHEWLEAEKDQRSASTQKEILSRLERDIFPIIGNRPIHDLETPELVASLKPIIARGRKETAKRMASVIRRVMDYAMFQGVIKANPASTLGRAVPNPIKKHQPSIKPEEFPKFLEDMENASLQLQTKLLFLWQLNTMVRPIEAASARWEDIDLESGEWTIPEQNMKMKKEHTVYLSSQSLSILKEMAPMSAHREFVFPHRSKPATHMTSQTVNMAIKRAGYSGKQVAHGLRSIASTILHGSGLFNSLAIERCLAHVDKDAVRDAYNNSDYTDERKRIYEWWSSKIESCLPIGHSYVGVTKK